VVGGGVVGLVGAVVGWVVGCVGAAVGFVVGCVGTVVGTVGTVVGTVDGTETGSEEEKTGSALSSVQAQSKRKMEIIKTGKYCSFFMFTTSFIL
jgi:hypothetical protein